MGTQDPTSERWTLSRLPFAARLTLAVFLISVGVGYASALVQLHFQHADPGEILPTKKNAVEMFHGRVGGPPATAIEVLITSDEGKPFSGQGQMRAAFFRRSEDWKKSKEATLRPQREGEIEAVLAWLRAGAPEEAWESDSFELPQAMEDKPITPKYVKTVEGGKGVTIKKLLTDRCVRCHQPVAEGGDPQASKYLLVNYEQWKPYVAVKGKGAMSLTKLAQTTHVHLLGFSMLYGLTGLILALTALPAFIRLPLAPLALVAQVVDISLWWLARLDEPLGPKLAEMIPISGAIVAGALGLQILLSLFSLFGKWGKVLLVLVIASTVGGGLGLEVHQKIQKHLDEERASHPSEDEKQKAKEEKKKKDAEAAYKAAMMKAETAMQAKMYEEAREAYAEALKHKPNDAAATRGEAEAGRLHEEQEEAERKQKEAEDLKNLEEEAEKLRVELLPPPSEEKDE